MYCISGGHRPRTCSEIEPRRPARRTRTERFSSFHQLRTVQRQAMRNALVFFCLGIVIYSLWPAGPKDYLLNTLELFHDFLEQPAVDLNGRIATNFKAQSLSYTLRASCELFRLLQNLPGCLLLVSSRACQSGTPKTYRCRAIPYSRKAVPPLRSFRQRREYREHETSPESWPSEKS